MHHNHLPLELQPYRKIVTSAIIRVTSTVTGASKLPRQDLYQEAWAIAIDRREHWEATARNLMAYARKDLTLHLANSARTLLRAQGYGKVSGKWTAMTPTLDPAIRGREYDFGNERQDGSAVVGLADAVDPEAVALERLEGPDDVPGVYGRSPHWARIFRRTFPEVAEEFEAIDDRPQSTLSASEFTRRKDQARARLRAKYAREIELVDAIEERHEDQRLIRAMFGRAV